MVKDKPQMDNLTLLSMRQGELSRKIRVGIQQRNGLNPKAWADIVDFEIGPSTPAGLSPRTRTVLEGLSNHGNFNVSANLEAFFWMLYDDFEVSRKEYVRKGWVTVEPGEPATMSTMSQPQEVKDVIGDATLDEEEEDDE